MEVIIYMCILVHVFSNIATSHKILLIPFEHISNERYFASVGQELAEDNHEVHILLPRLRPFFREEFKKLNIIEPNITTKSLLDDPDFSMLVFEVGNNIQKSFIPLIENCVSRCKDMLEDVKTLDYIKNQNYDLILIDGADFARCQYVIPHKFNIPYVTLNYRVDPWSAGLPVIPGLEPTWGMFYDPGNSTIVERLQSILQYVKFYLFMPPSNVISDDIIERYAPEQRGKTFIELYKNSEMFFTHSDPICLDFHRVSAPHYQFIGHLSVAPTKPISHQLNTLMDSHKRGTVLVAFGTAITSIPDNLFNTLMDAFGKIDMTVIMSYKNAVQREHIAPNIHIFSWLPQNDILSDNRTKLFITHGGNNGQFEAVYHGVPMIMIPVFGDQVFNARRAEMRGYGVVLDHKHISEDIIQSAVDEIMYNDQYLQNIQFCSSVIKSLPKGKDVLKFWVNHVLKFGGKHLKPRYFDRPLYELFMLDVLLVITVGVMCAGFFIMFTCRKIQYILCNTKIKHD